MGKTGTTSTAPGWACIDCMQLICNGETPPEMSEEETAAYLEAVEAGQEGCEAPYVTPGRKLGDDECECDDWDADEHRYGCEELEFTWSRCDVCRRPGQAGHRDAVTFWIGTDR